MWWVGKGIRDPSKPKPIRPSSREGEKRIYTRKYDTHFCTGSVCTVKSKRGRQWREGSRRKERLCWFGCSMKMVGFVLGYLWGREKVKASKVIFQAVRMVWANRNTGEGLAEGEETMQSRTKDSCGTHRFETKNILGNGESVRVLSNSSDVRNTGCEEEKSRGGRRGMLPGRKRSSHAASRLSHRSKCLLPTLYFHWFLPNGLLVSLKIKTILLRCNPFDLKKYTFLRIWL